MTVNPLTVVWVAFTGPRDGRILDRPAREHSIEQSGRRLKLTRRAGAALLLCVLCACAENAGPMPAGTVCGTTLLQVGNTSPCTNLVTKQSSELLDNRIGGVAHLPYSVALVRGAGFKWMRLAPDPTGRWQDVDWTSGVYVVDPAEDREIDERSEERRVGKECRL